MGWEMKVTRCRQCGQVLVREWSPGYQEDWAVGDCCRPEVDSPEEKLLKALFGGMR